MHICRTVGGLHYFHASQSFTPGQAGRFPIGEPANEVGKFQAIGMVEAKIVETFVVRLFVVTLLPVEIDVVQERDYPTDVCRALFQSHVLGAIGQELVCGLKDRSAEERKR